MSLSSPDIVGISGAIILLVAYALYQKGRVNIFYFSLWNGIGSLLIIYNLLFSWNISSFVIEIGWLIISGYGMIKHSHLVRKKA